MDALNRHAEGCLTTKLGAILYLDASFPTFPIEKVPMPVFLLKVEQPTAPPKSQNDLRMRERRVAGLVIRKKSDTEYARLGMFEYMILSAIPNVIRQSQSDLDWLDSGEVQTITVV
jgi:hypothetical protein